MHNSSTSNEFFLVSCTFISNNSSFLRPGVSGRGSMLKIWTSGRYEFESFALSFASNVISGKLTNLEKPQFTCNMVATNTHSLVFVVVVFRKLNTHRNIYSLTKPGIWPVEILTKEWLLLRVTG